MNIYDVFHFTDLFIEAIWVFIMSLWILIWLSSALVWYLQKKDFHTIYKKTREKIARSILLWLEILIAADIIKTVTTEFTVQSTATLWIIVLIRTVLSISLEMEIDWKFPWQKSNKK